MPLYRGLPWFLPHRRPGFRPEFTAYFPPFSSATIRGAIIACEGFLRPIHLLRRRRPRRWADQPAPLPVSVLYHNQFLRLAAYKEARPGIHRHADGWPPGAIGQRSITFRFRRSNTTATTSFVLKIDIDSFAPSAARNSGAPPSSMGEIDFAILRVAMSGLKVISTPPPPETARTRDPARHL